MSAWHSSAWNLLAWYLPAWYLPAWSVSESYVSAAWFATLGGSPAAWLGPMPMLAPVLGLERGLPAALESGVVLTAV